MNEKELSEKFLQALAEKGYGEESLIKDRRIKTISGGIFEPDLLIYDIVENECLAIIEFKQEFNKNTSLSVVLKLSSYAKAIGIPDIPSFLITSDGDQNYTIRLLLPTGEFSEVPEADFPDYSSLLYERREKKRIRNEIKILAQKNEFKAEVNQKRLSSALSILTVLLTIIVTLYSVNKQLNERSEVRKIADEAYRAIGTTKNISDSLARILDTVDRRNYVRDTVYVMKSKKDTLAISNLIADLERLKMETEMQKELTQTKIDAVKDMQSSQANWIIGVLVAILGATFSYALPYLFPVKTTK